MAIHSNNFWLKKIAVNTGGLSNNELLRIIAIQGGYVQ